MSENIEIVGRQKRNNYSNANFLSKIFFCWMFPTFIKGTKRELEFQDLSSVEARYQSNLLGDELEKAWFDEEKAAKEIKREPSLGRALAKVFILRWIPSGIMQLISESILRTCTPLLLSYLLKYWEVSNTDVMWNQAVMIALMMVMIVFVQSIFNQHAEMRNQQFGSSIRVACSSLLYRKILRMDTASLNGAVAARAVNLMANDVNRFDSLFRYLHFVWITPTQTIIVCYFMYQDIGWLAFIGIFAVIGQTLPIQIVMSRLAARFRLAVAQRTDERVRLMTEIINGIEVIKMYAWEEPFQKVVAASRKAEIDNLTKAAYVQGVTYCFMSFTERTSVFIMVVAYYILGQPLTASLVFVLVPYLIQLKFSYSFNLPHAIICLAESGVTLKRLQAFMVMREREDLALIARMIHIDQQSENGQMTHLEKCITKKEDTSKNFNTNDTSNLYFTNIGFEEDNYKSLDLMNDTDWAVNIDHVTAYWDGNRLSSTLADITMRVAHGKLCAIIGAVGSGKSSLLHLILGELQPVLGDVAVNGDISYASQEPWLFVGNARQNILFGLPYDEAVYRSVVAACALEDDFAQFPHGDQSLVGERGLILSGGQRARINLARAVYRQADVYLLDDPLSAVDAVVGRQLFEDCISNYLSGKTRLLVTHQLHYLKAADVIVVLNNGSIESISSFDELTRSGADFAKLLEELQEDSDAVVDDNELNHNKKADKSMKGNTLKAQTKEEILEEEEQATGSQGIRLYLSYFMAGSSVPLLILMATIEIMSQVMTTGVDYWIAHWTNEESSYFVNLQKANFTSMENKSLTGFTGGSVSRFFDRSYYLNVYITVVVILVIITFVRSMMSYKLCMKSSSGLHKQMFKALLSGVMSFFNSNPSGRIINRFSKDIGAVDELLPKAMLFASKIYLNAMGIFVLVAITLPWTTVIGILMLVFYHTGLAVYLKTARAIKRIETNVKSPVFSHLNSTLRGITTVRCTHSQGTFIEEFDSLQDNHSSAWLQYLYSSSTLGFWLDATVAVYLLVVSMTFLLSESLATLAGNVGLAISQTIALSGSLPYGIQQTAEMINQMTSVERVLQYTNIEKEEENVKKDSKKLENWPSSGAITMKKMNLSYAPNKPYALNDLNIEIEAGWKVGIVGRTGAGKTSLISALFRLAKVHGTIAIDGVDTSTLTLNDLRSNISIIPQEPVLFSATVRYNLDPFQYYDDAQLWDALEAVELKDDISSLDFKVLQGGSNFSMGQRQLVCLARAILKKNKILVLDEATANVDHKTDSLIQKAIRNKFVECTVLTIAHRLNTVMDSDRILVMSAGRAVQFGHPYTLLNEPDGVFGSMVKETGSKMASQLYSVAEKTFYSQFSESYNEHEVVFKL